MKKLVDRTVRVAGLIQEALASILQRNRNDAALAWVTITGVVVSRDLAYAKIYVSVLSDDLDTITKTIQTLNQQAKDLRFHLAKVVNLRIIPELKFFFDESTQHGFRISSLIDQATKHQ